MINDFCSELNRFLQNSYSLTTPPAHCNHGTINAVSDEFKLYFRYRPGNEKELVVARIEFEKERKGHGTNLLKFISDVVELHDIEKIILENVNEDSYNFGLKMGFVEYVDINHETVFSSKDMVISSKDLIDKFHKKR